MPGPPGQKVITLLIADRVLLQTDGTTTSSVVPSDLPAVLDWGPHIESVRAVTITWNRTTNHRWKVIVTWSNDGNNYQTPVEIFSAIVADGQTVENEYTTTDNLSGLNLRFGLANSNVTGSAVESAMVSCWLIFTFKT